MHPNEQVLRDADEAQARGDAEAFMGFYTDDVIIHISGKSSFSGVYKGKDRFAEVFGRFMERAPEYTFAPHAYFADMSTGSICSGRTTSAATKRSTPTTRSSAISATARSRSSGT